MKKVYIILSLALATAGIFTACKKSQFDERYYDPEKTTKGTIDGLYGGIFKNKCVFPDYRNVFTFIGETVGRYTQTVGFLNNNKMYEANPDYMIDRWNNFYAATGGDGNWTASISSYREIEKLYDQLPDEEKAGYLLFLETARIYVYDQATQMVDLWGDIPFTNAGLLNSTGTLKLASYDEGKAVYDSAFSNLKRISNYLATVQPEQFYINKLGKEDMLFKGDLQKWRRYCNSLILRLAMRISNIDEERAKGIVQEILSNPTKYPVIDAITDNVQLTAASPNLLTTGVGAAWTEFNHSLAPGYMVDSLLEPTGDPRLRILFNKNVNGQYQGMPTSWNNTDQQTAIGKQEISTLDSVTFLRNDYFPGIIFTAAEVSFIKAEVYQRWGGGTAKTAYEQGIRQSIAYYFKIHQLSTYGTQETVYTEPEIVLLLANPKVAYGTDPADNLNKIFLQKWLDFGAILCHQSWAEMRRSGLPKLSFPTDASSNLAKLPPYRITYPATERTMNAENYAAVADKDGFFAKIFWMK